MITKIDENESSINFEILNNKLKNKVYTNIVNAVYADAYKKNLL